MDRHSIDQRVATAEAALARRLAMSVTSSRLSVPTLGIELRTLEHVRSQLGPVSLLLHGATLSAAWYLPLMRELPGRCVAVDLPGHGLSSGYDPRRHDLRTTLVDVVRATVDARAEGAGPVRIIGNSLGGMAALWTALDRPSLVSEVVLLGAPGVAFGGRADVVLGLLATPAAARVILAGRTRPSWYAAGLARSLREPALHNYGELGTLAYWASRREAFRLSVPRILRELLRYRTPRPSRVLGSDELARVRQPTTVIWGRDESFAALGGARSAVDRMPSARLIEVQGGHTPWLLDPRATARLLDAQSGDHAVPAAPGAPTPTQLKRNLGNR